MVTSLRINIEGAELYFQYEILREGENVDIPEIGVFYIYCSDTDSIPVHAIVDSKELITALYLAILDLAADGYNRKHSDFEHEWYYSENSYAKRKWSNMTFYNLVKSPLIEWYIHTDKFSRHSPRFRKMPKIRETIQMWCDYGHALFWGNDACIGDSDSISTDTAGEIDLSGIKGLYEWYNEWNKTPLEEVLYNDNEMVSADWFERGRQLAFQVRELLPDTIDLYYCSWYPTVKVMQERSFDSLGNEYHFPERLPMIVPRLSE